MVVKFLNKVYTDPVQIEYGEEDGHILYQSMRNDTTGNDRLGLWYAHGDIKQSSWTYKKAVGDYASLPQMKVNTIDDEDRLIVAWKEGEGIDSELITRIVDDTFSIIENSSMQFSARGLSQIAFIETSRGIQVMHDMVGSSGPQVQYGMINSEVPWMAISNRISDGWLHLVSRSSASDETVIIHTSTQGWVIRTVIDDSKPNTGPTDILDELRFQLGLDEGSFNILVGGVAIAVLLLCTIVLAVMSGRAISWIGGRRRKTIQGVIMLEDDVVDVIDEDDIPVEAIDTSSIVEVVDINVENTSLRRERRQRRTQPKMAEISTNIPEMTPPATNDGIVAEPLPPMGGVPSLPGLPPLNKPVLCTECGSRFDVAFDLKMTRCPICALRIDL